MINLQPWHLEFALEVGVVLQMVRCEDKAMGLPRLPGDSLHTHHLKFCAPLTMQAQLQPHRDYIIGMESPGMLIRRVAC